MIITFVRSSSYNTHTMCPHKFLLDYTLGIPTPSGKAADKGNVVHKALELIAYKKLCEQNGWESYEDDTFGCVSASQITPDWALDVSYDYYATLANHHRWWWGDFDDCKKWMYKALEDWNGLYDPRSMNIIQPEQKFDFVIDKPWARYSYCLPNGETVEGQLGIKGTVDLVVGYPDDPKTIKVIDWKTGARRDWAKDYDNEKTPEDLRNDPQLLLYHYAISHVYPDVDTIFITIVYINKGGPYSFPFERSDLGRTEEMIRKKFEEIRDTQVPELKIGKKCTSFCHFGKTKSKEDPSKTMCQYFADKVREEGLDAVMRDHGQSRSWERYGQGGGRQA